MPWYKGLTLIETLDQKLIPKSNSLNKPLRGLVQDVYPFENDQNIVVSKIETGILTLGKEIIFTPSQKKSTIKKIVAFDSEVNKAEPGDSVGLILEDSSDIVRGEVLSYPQTQPPKVNNFVAEVILFSGFQIKNNDVFTIRLGTAEKK